MILTASILWAVLATARWRANYSRANSVIADAKAISEAAMLIADQRDTWRRLATDLQDKIDRDAAKRSSITSRGNITRAANRRAKVLEQASKLVAPKVDRIAA